MTLPDLTRLPHPWHDDDRATFLYTGSTYRCLGRFITKPGIVLARHGEARPEILDLSERLL